MARPIDPNRTGDDAPRDGERIAKLLARAGIASRREIERYIAEGRVALDGTPLTTAATVLTSLRGVTVDGNPVAAPEPARLFLYHKPVGLLVTERDPRGRPTIYDRLPAGLPRVVPVGRLDAGTEGLLLLTTDGGLKRQLELPATGVERTYRARAHGRVGQEALEELIHGIEIEGVRYGSIDANLERRTGANAWIELTLTEGKNREVRRVLEHLGVAVNRLIRTRYGPFVLGELPPGAVGEVRGQDIATFRQALAAKRPRVEERVAVTAGGAVRTRARPAAPAKPLADGRSGPAPGRPALPKPRSTEAQEPRSSAGRRPAATRPRGGIIRAQPLPVARRDEPARSKPAAPQPVSLPAGAGEEAESASRLPRPQRKAGWAKPKPRPNARPPKKR